MKQICRHLQWNGIFGGVLLKVPQVVVYKANSVSLRIAKVFVKVKIFPLPILSLTAQPLSFAKGGHAQTHFYFICRIHQSSKCSSILRGVGVGVEITAPVIKLRKNSLTLYLRINEKINYPSSIRPNLNVQAQEQRKPE